MLYVALRQWEFLILTAVKQVKKFVSHYHNYRDFSYNNVIGIWQNVLNCEKNNVTVQNRHVLKDGLSWPECVIDRFHKIH